jgi:predicted DNA-binding protein with PD1-like motif
VKYQIGRQGRIVVAKFDDDDGILEGITAIAKNENIRSAVFFLVGGMKEGRFVVGPKDESFPPVPVWREMAESHETFGTGTIFWEGDVPKIHFHGTFAKGDRVRAGCLREKAHTFLVLEAVIIEIEGIAAVRKKDDKTGLSLLNL